MLTERWGIYDYMHTKTNPGHWSGREYLFQGQDRRHRIFIVEPESDYVVFDPPIGKDGFVRDVPQNEGIGRDAVKYRLLFLLYGFLEGPYRLVRRNLDRKDTI